MSDDSAPILSIIILNWNTADLLRACLQSIPPSPSYEIIVVDNHSSDGSVEMVRAEFPQVALLAQAENLGFSRGNNVGLEVANGRYLLLLNPDTEIKPGALERIIQFMDEHEEAAIVGPTVRNPDGSLQPSTSPLPSLRREFLRQTMLFRLLPASHDNKLRQVESVSGAALFIRKAWVERIGPLDPHIFMFYEDSDWCQRTLAAGGQIWFVPCAGIMHHKSAASSRFARTRTLIASQRGAVYYFRKHRGAGAIFVLRLITLVGMLARSARAALNWLLGRNRSDQRARLRAYGQILRWAFTGRGLDG